MKKIGHTQNDRWMSPSSQPKRKACIPNHFVISEMFQLVHGFHLFSQNHKVLALNTSFMLSNFAILLLYFSVQIGNLGFGHFSPLSLIPIGLNSFNLIVCVYLFVYRRQINQLSYLFENFLGKVLSFFAMKFRCVYSQSCNHFRFFCVWPSRH